MAPHTEAVAPARRPTVGELADMITQELARVRAVDLDGLREELRGHGGDLEMDSREAEVVIGILEQRYDRKLATIDDLEPEQLPSVAAVARLLHRRWDTTGQRRRS